VNAERVTFTADGLTLVGNLAVAADGAPAVVLTGPFTGVKEQVVGTYAARLRERGLTTLAFDHRGFGESEGRRAHAYYGTQRSAAGRWENRVTYGSLHTLMTFDALGAAPMLGATPLLVVHGRKDAYCAPELAEALYADATGPKEIRWIEAERHIDLYDVEPYVAQAADATATFLHRTL
jgi:fermentation-respiration switch protein FrsA (DUF1100 family)